MTGRTKIPEEIRKLTKSQLLTVIDESALGLEDTTIARRVLIDKWPQIDVATEIGYDRSVISRRTKYIFERIIFIAQKIYQ